ncbi:MAG: hypothetical protein ACI8TQ_002212, partial [Planctomycetota bacterium]
RAVWLAPLSLPRWILSWLRITAVSPDQRITADARANRRSKASWRFGDNHTMRRSCLLPVSQSSATCPSHYGFRRNTVGQRSDHNCSRRRCPRILRRCRVSFEYFWVPYGQPRQSGVRIEVALSEARSEIRCQTPQQTSALTWYRTKVAKGNISLCGTQ